MSSDVTPRPWMAAARPSSIVGWPIVSTAQGRSVANVTWMPKPPDMDQSDYGRFHAECAANAALIVEAVNNFDRLQSELAKAREDLAAARVALHQTRFWLNKLQPALNVMAREVMDDIIKDQIDGPLSRLTPPVKEGDDVG